MKNIDLRQKDSLKELLTLKDSSVNLIIADPPYNLGKNYGNSSDKKSKEEYLEFTRFWLKEAVRVLRDNGTIYIFMGVRFISYLYLILEEEFKLDFKAWIVWHYTQGMGKTKSFSPRHDDILMFSKGRQHCFNLDNVRIPQKYYRQRNNMRGANPGDVWEFSHIHYSNPNRKAHPTQKPEGLIERLVLASSNENDIVLDPFSGSGTTARVCQQLMRKFIGFELNSDYIDMTKERLEDKFVSFDSIDPRSKRVPNDLRKEKIRNTYLKNHIKWFLSNHKNAYDDFRKDVLKKYGVDIQYIERDTI
tara:strand:+ start:375 stop:1286 length:912 start_codon:yes stop_codon:yes gene_type:complete